MGWCDMCDGRFPDTMKGKHIDGAFWFCDKCAEENDRSMEKMRQERIQYWLDPPNPIVSIICRDCGEAEISLHRGTIIEEIGRNKDFDMCIMCQDSREDDLTP